MASELPLKQIVSVRSRFTRSVSLPRDWDRGEALDGYILTPSGREILSTDTPTAQVVKLSEQFGGEIPGLTVARPTLEDTYLEMISKAEVTA